MKAYCKVHGISINDLVMSVLSTSMHEYLGMKDDNQKLNILLPANIRYKFYETKADVKCENRFSALPIRVPILAKMKDSHVQIKKLTQQIKKNFGYIYSGYALTMWGTLLGPRSLPRAFLHNAAMGFTCAFSNNAGPLKCFQMDDGKGHKCTFRYGYTYVMVSGRVGMCISCFS
jgi:hypothetical protein